MKLKEFICKIFGHDYKIIRYGYRTYGDTGQSIETDKVVKCQRCGVTNGK